MGVSEAQAGAMGRGEELVFAPQCGGGATCGERRARAARELTCWAFARPCQRQRELPSSPCASSRRRCRRLAPASTRP